MVASRARSLMAVESRQGRIHGSIYHVFKWRMAGNLFLFINEKYLRHFDVDVDVVAVGELIWGCMVIRHQPYGPQLTQPSRTCLFHNFFHNCAF